MALPQPILLPLLGLLAAVPAAGRESPALAPTPVTRADASQYGDDQRRFQGIPSVAISEGGRLWATWYSGGAGEGPENYVLLATSGDSGLTWSKPLFVIDPESPVRAYDAVVWRAPGGVLWWFYAQTYGQWDGRAGVWAVTTRNADDPLPTWSAPRRIADGIMMNKPVATREGRWLFPIARWSLKPSPGMPGPRRPVIPNPHLAWDPEAVGTHVYQSRDQGATITRLGTALIPDVRYDEHHVIERRDHTWWILARTNAGISESFSSDGGATWALGRPSPIPNAPSRFFIRRLSSGNLLLVKHNPPLDQPWLVAATVQPSWRQRSHLTAYLSEDDGATWKGGLLLDDRLVVSYPDGDQAADGTIFLVYDHNREGDREILMARFTEEDVLARQPVSPGARFRLLV
ncbi:MAG: exo-alpha-sialidase, partial [Verrucomicrobia bacterium]|nr:exo-alpha-sialidase [Verrucomicrobiota bacterium]